MYISNDWSALGRYLQRERRVYTLCEDTFGGTLDPDQHLLDEQRANPRGPYRYWATAPAAARWKAKTPRGAAFLA